METVIPPRLRDGDMIGLVSPSSPPTDDALIMRGITALLEKGHYPRLGWSVGARDGYLSGPDQLRASDLMDMFEDDRVRAIFCTRGGYGSARLLDGLDFGYIRNKPRIFVGFSDITALSLALYAKSGLITFAGPMVAAEFASGIRPLTAGALWEILSIRRETQLLPACHDVDIMRPGVAEGRLLGGNLTVLSSMIGTPWLPDFRGAILFLEDVGEAVYRIDRMLFQLKHAGMLRQLSGVMLGSFTAVQDDGGERNLNHVLQEYLLPLEIPVMTGIPFGHIPEKITLPIGATVRMDTNLKSVTVLHAVVA